jgi:hypothetical protein
LEIPEAALIDTIRHVESRTLMAKPKKNREKAKGGPPLPSLSEEPPAGTTRVLPMELQVGDQLMDETGTYQVIGRPFTTAGGKTANVRVKRADSGAEMVRVWGAHECIAVRRGDEQS